MRLFCKNLAPVATLALAMLAVPACNDSGFKATGREEAVTTPLPRSIQTETFSIQREMLQSAAVDIVFVVDTSGSMLEEKELLERNMSSFLQEFQRTHRQLDYRVYMIGERFRFPPNLDTSRFLAVNQFVGSTTGLGILESFLAGKLSSTVIRPNSSIEAIIITDDNAEQPLRNPPPGKVGGLDAANFKQAVLANPDLSRRQIHINGLVGKKAGINKDGCTIEELGSDYETLASDPKFAGVMLDLCSPANMWTQMLSGLAQNILDRSGGASATLSQSPDLNRQILVFLDDRQLNPDDYSVRSDGYVTLNPSANVAPPSDNPTLKVIYYPL